MATQMQAPAPVSGGTPGGYTRPKNAPKSLFDPEIVSVFLSIPAETWSTIARGQRLTAMLPSRLRQDNAILRPDASIIP